ncbi:hypothetical protein H7K45_27670 [Mycobacterium yunnanensis]|uniref:DUF7172 domain-containing protein n=1 Tax=Mycobacterium yunnanensis TaxID=368477 RepID=A0A9X2ZA03_9MYCO|nr:hypothetical protein [Mycobacterium yunnanensis]MCV7424331.1 hypothetical protein [Mycobacterium yunnanensis]
MAVQDWTEPNVCVDENIGVDSAGLLVIQPFAVPRVVADVKTLGTGDTAQTLFPETALPGRMLKDQKVGWRNETPLPTMVMIRVIRASKAWITSNPNAIQFRDRWTYTIDEDDVTPELPITTGIYNSQTGSAIDLGTNTVAEPNPGVQYAWMDGNAQDEWVGPIAPGEKLNVWYREYVWTPPPFSDNANKNKPLHKVQSPFTRIMLWAFPAQGTLVAG